MRIALVLAHEPGHRIGAIRRLRWSDVNLDAGCVRWRAEADKMGFQHETPLTPVARAALEQARRRSMSIGETWVFPAPQDAMKPASRYCFRDWWRRCEEAAELEHVEGMGWHSLRRKFATELKAVPLKDLCELGGWKTPETVLECYQRPDEETMRRALAERKPLRAAANRET